MSEPGRALWAAYEALGWAATPLAAPHLARRARIGKEDPARWGEKQGRPSALAFHTPPVWLHGVSVGESVAAMALAREIDGPVLLTSSTPASAARVAANAPANVVHQYAPLDSVVFLRRFLAHWRPRAALFVEGEIWPATIRTLARRAIPLALANARMSDKTFERWSRQPRIAEPLFAEIPRVLAETPKAAARYEALGAPDVRLTGQIKFDAPPPLPDAAALAALRTAVGDRPVWLAASTHEQEEAVIIGAHHKIARDVPGLLTIIAPRHPERGAAVAVMAGNAPRRSEGALPDQATGIYLADTLGEMGTFFSLSPVVFLGASFVPLGGHNPAEPAAYGAALLTGPEHGDMFIPFLDADAARIIDRDTLPATVTGLLENASEREALCAAATTVLAREKGATRRTLAAVADWLANP